MNEMEICARPQYFWDVILVCRDGNYNCLDFSIPGSYWLLIHLILHSSLVSNVDSNCGIEEHLSSCSCIFHKLCQNSWAGALGLL